MIKKIITSFILSIILVVTVQAAMGIPDTYKPKNIPLQGLNTTITEAVKADSQGGAVTGVNIVLQYMANLLLFFAAPLAVLFLARAGADYAFAMGEDSKLESAKRELTWSIIGLVLVMFSYVLVRVLIQPAVMLQTATEAALPTQIEQGAEAICQAKYSMSCDAYAKLSDAEKAKIDVKSTAGEEAQCKAMGYASCAEYTKQNTTEAINAKAAEAKAAAEQAAQAKKDAAEAILNRATLENPEGNSQIP